MAQVEPVEPFHGTEQNLRFALTMYWDTGTLTWVKGTQGSGGGGGDASAANQVTLIGHVDGIETLLASLDGKVPSLSGGRVPVVAHLTPPSSGGLSTFMASGSDGSTILQATAQEIKATAGQLYAYFIYNPEASVSYVHFYNSTAAGVTVGTTSPKFSLPIPAGAAANVSLVQGAEFTTAISCAATTTAGGNTSPATGVSLVAFYN